jgi:hypothetical protein
MKVKPEDYGTQARTLLVKTALLMIKHKINLNADTFKDKMSRKKKPADSASGEAPSVIGWLIELHGKRFEHRAIGHYINQVVNLVLEQMQDREETVSFPNEHCEAMVEAGVKLWHEVDPEYRLRVRR